jgi:hypothetical protein
MGRHRLASRQFASAAVRSIALQVAPLSVVHVDRGGSLTGFPFESVQIGSSKLNGILQLDQPPNWNMLLAVVLS